MAQDNFRFWNSNTDGPLLVKFCNFGFGRLFLLNSYIDFHILPRKWCCFSIICISIGNLFICYMPANNTLHIQDGNEQCISISIIGGKIYMNSSVFRKQNLCTFSLFRLSFTIKCGGLFKKRSKSGAMDFFSFSVCQKTFTRNIPKLLVRSSDTKCGLPADCIYLI